MPELKTATWRDKRTGKGFDLAEQENGKTDFILYKSGKVISHLSFDKATLEALKIKIQQV